VVKLATGAPWAGREPTKDRRRLNAAFVGNRSLTLAQICNRAPFNSGPISQLLSILGGEAAGTSPLGLVSRETGFRPNWPGNPTAAVSAARQYAMRLLSALLAAPVHKVIHSYIHLLRSFFHGRYHGIVPMRRRRFRGIRARVGAEIGLRCQLMLHGTSHHSLPNADPALSRCAGSR
jgi:hypothetical protein